MAMIDPSLQDTRTQEERIAAGDSPEGSNAYYGTSGRIDVAPGLDVKDIERQLREAGGGLFHQSDLEGVLRNTGYQSGGTSLERALENARQNYEQRRTNIPGQDGGGDGGGGGNGGGGFSMPGGQFDDAYSKMLEDIAKAQMGETRSNPALDKYLSFLDQRFSDLSTNPGWSPQELALLNTQAFEPIESLRRATQQRELERTARAGYMPTSGLTRDNQRTIDTTYDQMRTAANRDLGVRAIDQRNRDLAQAQDIGQMRAITIPAAQRGEELALGNLLYQMPRTALQDALSVINGTPSSNDAFTQALSLLNANRSNDMIASQQNAALMGQIGSILAELFA